MRAATLEDFAAAPTGRYVAGPTFAHACVAPKLWAVLLWGRPSEEHAIQLGRSLVLELAPPAEPHASIIDASRLESSDPGAFGAAGRYLTRHHEALASWVTRLALVRPSGFGGALVSGAYEVLPRPYPVALFDAADAALVWLAEGLTGAPPPSAVAASLAAIHAEAIGASPLVSALRVRLGARLGGVTLADAAAELGLSERTLQRKLAEAKTSFQDELADARVRAAQGMLLDGDAPLTVIALEVGCASLQHFSALFRKRTGESPSAWRKSRR